MVWKQVSNTISLLLATQFTHQHSRSRFGSRAHQGHYSQTFQHTVMHTLKNNLTVNLNTLTIIGIQAENSLPLSTKLPNSFTSLSINVFRTLNSHTTLR